MHDFEQHPEYAFKRFGILDKICRWLTSEDPRILYEWDQIDRWLVTRDERILTEWSFKFNAPFADVAEALEDVIRNEKNR